MKKKKAVAMTVLGLMLLCILPGCTPSADSSEILVGVAWSFAAENNLFNEGIDLAAAQINANGGINGKTLKLLKADDGSQAVKGVAIAQAFAQRESIMAVIGHRNSYVSIPASSIYEKADLTMLSPSSTASELTQKGYKNIFRSIPNNSEIARRVAAYLAGLGLKRLVIYYSDDAYGTGLANAFEEEAGRLGAAVVDRFHYYSDIQYLKRLQSRWQAFSFDGVFVAVSSAADGARFIAGAREIGIRHPMAAGDALDAPELAAVGGKAAEGTVVGSVFDPQSSRPEVKSFVEAFEKEYKAQPTCDAAMGYDAVHMLAAAIQKNGVSGRASVADGLRGLGKWTGVCGVHELGATGDDLGDLVVLKQVKNGELICLEN